MPFPTHRLRRLRRTEGLRRMVREHHLRVEHLIQPYFVIEGDRRVVPIASMPDQAQLSVDQLIEAVAHAIHNGIGAVLLFGIPDHKDEAGSQAYAEDGIIQRATRALKRHYPELVVITDLCLCEYTSHGHCGHVAHGEVRNDETLDLLVKGALAQAQAGADIIAPSDMMDGRIGRIRTALDAAGYSDVAIMAYAAKFASAFYGPFRDAAQSAPAFGDRRAYQMDPANGREALWEIALDDIEGADILMVKPALPYLDVLARARPLHPQPFAVYHVSGEYAMLKAAVERGWLDERRCVMESLLAMRRAGADLIITYYAVTVAAWLQE